MNESDLLKKIKPHLKKIEYLHDKRNYSYYNFIKNITTISIGLLGLLVTLKPENIPQTNAKYCFILSLISLSLVCVFSLITQFSETSHYNNLLKDLKKVMLDVHLNNTSVKSEVLISNKKWIYKLSELMTYSCLLISIISLIFYVYFLEFP